MLRTGTGRDTRPTSSKAERTRQRLLASAATVFAQRGYLPTRVADIVKNAGVAHGTFYTYFTSKEDIFRAVAVSVVDDVIHALDAPQAGTAEERIRAANRGYMIVYEEHAAVLGLIEQVATFNEEFRELRLELRNRFVNRIARAIRRLQDGGVVTSEHLDPWIAANALGGMVDNFAYTWFTLRQPFDPDEALRTLDVIWLRALGVRSGGATESGDAVEDPAGPS